MYKFIFFYFTGSNNRNFSISLEKYKYIRDFSKGRTKLKKFSSGFLSLNCSHFNCLHGHSTQRALGNYCFLIVMSKKKDLISMSSDFRSYKLSYENFKMRLPILNNQFSWKKHALEFRSVLPITFAMYVFLITSINVSLEVTKGRYPAPRVQQPMDLM
jgi:hypothetical protein